ncbi:ras-related protein Rab-20-like isoform X2 [Dreissena polymorpha]|uniref:ras-related protein Rab-20-like isoform X2 n=1 Tax=Dreissena polymorpha TaxID=45954 RepID=UPI0022652CC9|nr:ras-related protein Rab-20-like isoform X2 [Dreissena polymorpha]
MATPAGAKKKADAKVIILGDYAVGKTSLISRYIDGSFNPHEPDTAGDEKYTGLSSFYCRNAGAAILAFDLNTASSYESLWARFLPLLDAAHEDCLKVVVGTKRDMLKETDREISVDEAIEFSKEINKNIDLSRLKGDPYFETSAKSGYNVSRVFEYMFQYCLPDTKLQLPRDTIVVSNAAQPVSSRCSC